MERAGYVIYVDKIAPRDTVVWADDRFYRIPSASKVFHPLTPVVIITSFEVDLAVGKFGAANIASFDRVLLGDEANSVGLPFLEGSFTKRAQDKVTFVFNPEGYLSSPMQASFWANSYPGLALDIEVLALFHTQRPRFSSDRSVPVIKTVRSQGGRSTFAEPGVTHPSSRLSPGPGQSPDLQLSGWCWCS